MRIAILGAGFSGLSAAWHLLDRDPSCQVALFDPKGIGGGASGIAAGLLHPYVGEEGRRSLLASEGIKAARELIAASEKSLGRKVADQSGIVRRSLNEELTEQFHSHIEKHGDVKHLSGQDFLIQSGITVDCPSYLEGLWKGIAERGGELFEREVGSLSSLEGFDQIIVAAGAGIRRFPELSSFRYKVVKGQVLVCRAKESADLPDRSLIGKGYVALSLEAGTCYLGSTYEKGDVDEVPNLAFAKEALISKIGRFYPGVENLETVGCRAALRVIRSGHYFPIAAKVQEGLYVLAAMGSRGLLYHAFLGKLLAEAVLTGDDSALSFLSINGKAN